LILATTNGGDRLGIAGAVQHRAHPLCQRLYIDTRCRRQHLAQASTAPVFLTRRRVLSFPDRDALDLLFAELRIAFIARLFLFAFTLDDTGLGAVMPRPA
jgi:hypothetical protein